MSEKPPVPKKKVSKKPKRKSGTSSPKTPKSKSSETSSPRPPDSEPLPKSFLPSRLCLIHKKELKKYCDNREELICEECALNPSYSRYPCKVVTLEEAFRMRLSGLYNVLNNYILPKRLQVAGQQIKVGECLATVKTKKSEIERDMKGEFSAMNERLNFSYGTKQAILQHELKELQIDLDRIQHIISLIESSANDQVAFLQRSSDLRSLMDLALSKPFRVSIDIHSEDLPKELNKVREIINEFPAMQQLVKVKDEMVWKLLHENQSPKEMDEAYQRELAEWARLTEKYTQELRKFQINCEYCACGLSEETVNTNCSKNLKGENRKNSRLQGTGRHFFTDDPRPDLGNSMEEPRPDLQNSIDDPRPTLQKVEKDS